MKRIKTILKWALRSAKVSYNLMAVNAEVLCRHSFGQRYAPSLLASFFFCFVTMTVLQALANRSSAFVGFYLLFYFFLVLYDLGRMWLPRRTLHSYSNGQSWGFWRRCGLRPSIVQMLFEPAVVVLIGLLVLRGSVLLSVWLQVAGLCLFIKEAISKWQQHNRVLDGVDARLEGERINTGIRRYTTPQSGGDQRASRVVAVEEAQQPTTSIAQIHSRLDPALQQLISSPNQNRPNPPPVGRTPNRQGPRRYHAGPLGTLPRITSRPPRKT
jgi:hypothetical protein